MARVTQGRQDEIRQSDVYDDTLAAGAELETVGTDVQYDLNALRSLRKADFNLANWYEASSGGGGGGSGGGYIVATGSTLAVAGPGAGVIPTQRTYKFTGDPTTTIVVDYTYKVDGWTVDTKTVTVDSDPPVAYQAQYAASGIRTHWAPL